jgi:hypothetical protein
LFLFDEYTRNQQVDDRQKNALFYDIGRGKRDECPELGRTSPQQFHSRTLKTRTQDSSVPLFLLPLSHTDISQGGKSYQGRG